MGRLWERVCEGRARRLDSDAGLPNSLFELPALGIFSLDSMAEVFEFGVQALDFAFPCSRDALLDCVAFVARDPVKAGTEQNSFGLAQTKRVVLTGKKFRPELDEASECWRRLFVNLIEQGQGEAVEPGELHEQSAVTGIADGGVNFLKRGFPR